MRWHFPGSESTCRKVQRSGCQCSCVVAGNTAGCIRGLQPRDFECLSLNFKGALWNYGGNWEYLRKWFHPFFTGTGSYLPLNAPKSRLFIFSIFMMKVAIKAKDPIWTCLMKFDKFFEIHHFSFFIIPSNLHVVGSGLSITYMYVHC